MEAVFLATGAASLRSAVCLSQSQVVYRRSQICNGRLNTKRGNLSGIVTGRIGNSRYARSTRDCVGVARAAVVDGTEGLGSDAARIEGRRFPFLSSAGGRVMNLVAEMIDKELGPMLLASGTPADVRYFKSPQGNAEGSVILRSGKDDKVDFTLESWIHATLPFGTLDIATIVIMLGPGTDSPHFLFEFIKSGPTLVVVLDHLPRKDLVLNQEYVKRFYEDTGLERVRKLFEKAPDSSPYLSPVLFVRSVVSPTAVLYKLNGSAQVDGGGLEEQIADVVYPGAQQILQAWFESLSKTGLPVLNAEDMSKRDERIKTFGVEVDLSANLPPLFGQEITDRIVQAFRAGGK